MIVVALYRSGSRAWSAPVTTVAALVLALALVAGLAFAFKFAVVPGLVHPDKSTPASALTPAKIAANFLSLMFVYDIFPSLIWKAKKSC
jgi:hypothetical protein